MNIRKLSSLALVVALLFSLIIPTGILAEEQVNVTAGPGEQKAEEVNNVEVAGDTPAVIVFSNGENASAEVTVVENVSDTNDGDASGVHVQANNDGSSSADVGGNVTASAESGNSVGVEAFTDAGTTEVRVEGNVKASSNSDASNGHSTGVSANSNGSGGSTNVEVGGNVASSFEFDGTGNASTTGVSTSSNGDNTSTGVSVGGNVTATTESTGSGMAGAIGVSLSSSDSEENGSTKVTVKEDVTASSIAVEYSHSTGVSVGGMGGNTKDVIIGGNVTSSSTSENDNSYSAGLYATSSGENTSTEVSVGGNIVTTSVGNDNTNATGISVSSEDSGSNATITVGGNVTVSGESGNGHVSANGLEASSNNGGTTEISVGQDVNVTVTSNSGSYASASGLIANSYDENSKTNVEIAGTVSVQTNKGAYGIQATAGKGGTVDVSIGDGISVAADGNGSHIGIDASAYGKNSVVNVAVTGDVALSGKSSSVYDIPEESESESQSHIPTEPSYYVSDPAMDAYVSNGGIVNISIADGSSASIIEKDVTVKKNGEIVDTYSYTSGLGASVQEGYSVEPIAGEVTIRVEDKDGNDENESEFFKSGNIVGGDTGLQVVLNENSETTVNVIASGTIGGENAAVLVNKNVTEDNLSLTVWKIIPTETVDEENHVVVTKEVTEEGTVPVSTDQTKKIEENIRYIIKVEPNANATLTTGGTTEYEGYNVAHEGDRVTLKVNAADGYYIEGAYNGLGERIPLQYADGVYYIDVPMGGGVYLSARVGKHEDPAPDDSSSTPAVHVTPGTDGWNDIAGMDSVNRVVIPAANRFLKTDERKMMAALPPIQQLLVVLTKAGFTEAVNASGFALSDEAKKLADSLNTSFSGVVQIVYKWENDVKVKWHMVELVLPVNRIVRAGFRKLEDGSWVFKMF